MSALGNVIASIIILSIALISHTSQGLIINFPKSDAIAVSARFGHFAVVERLLKDGRFDPTVHDNDAIVWAAEFGFASRYFTRYTSRSQRSI
jgi:hypothetical protein